MSRSLPWLKDTPAKEASPAAGWAGSTSELVGQRERLTERFALMQSELGGLFYEMAIRDHVQMDVLIAKAAELQQLDAELGQIEHMLLTNGADLSGHCESCGASHARGAAFCSRCGTALRAT
jgi:hypothetical protein